MIQWLRRLFRRDIGLSKHVEDYPNGTPLWGVCYTCGVVLVYPPITIATQPSPSSKQQVYDICWLRYCKHCALHRLKSLDELGMVPDRAWCMSSTTVVDNPFKQRRT